MARKRNMLMAGVVVFVAVSFVGTALIGPQISRTFPEITAALMPDAAGKDRGLQLAAPQALPAERSAKAANTAAQGSAAVSPKGGQTSTSGEGGQTQLTDRMIVYNTTISLAVESVPEGVNSISALAEGVGGFVAGTSLRYQEGKEHATLTLRVPAAAYHQVMNALRKMAVKVTNETGSARDVTEEFTDWGAQLRNWEATEAQYLALLKRANTIDEILKVQAQLSQVRGQIERIKGKLNLLQRTADMATIAVNLAPAEAAKGKEPKLAWDPTKTVEEAWEQSLVIVQALADVGLRVLVFSWWLVPPTLLAWGVWATTRRPQRPTVDA